MPGGINILCLPPPPPESEDDAADDPDADEGDGVKDGVVAVAAAAAAHTGRGTTGRMELATGWTCGGGGGRGVLVIGVTS